MGNLFLVIFILALVVFYFWAIMPHRDKARRQECLTYATWDFAHRGLWSREQQIPENSIPAFERAIKQQVAIELDVHLTKDNRLVVIHDSSLKRLCGVDGIVEQKTFSELSTLRLSGTEYGIPLLGQALRIIRGRVPILIEIKADTMDISICSYLYKELEFYTGDYLIQSFNPLTLRWFHKHAPHVLTGQLAGNVFSIKSLHPIMRFGLYTLLVNGVSRPDFVSYDLHDIDCLSVRIVHRLYRAPIFAWLARTMNEYRQCKAEYDAVIFEEILP